MYTFSSLPKLQIPTLRILLMVISKAGNRREIVKGAVAGGRKMQIGKRKKRQERRQVPKNMTGKEEMKGRNTGDLKSSRMYHQAMLNIKIWELITNSDQSN